MRFCAKGKLAISIQEEQVDKQRQLNHTDRLLKSCPYFTNFHRGQLATTIDCLTNEPDVLKVGSLDGASSCLT